MDQPERFLNLIAPELFGEPPRRAAHVAVIAVDGCRACQMAEERRNYSRRGEVIQRIVCRVVQNPSARFTFKRFRAMLGVPDAAARRILASLTSSGLVVEVERDVWERSH